jgi:hypothetical protein
MSIQEVTKKNLSSKIDSFFLVLYQFFSRLITRKKIRIFFRYQTKNTHPSFKRFYDHPPIAWSNAVRYDLAHWINYPAWKNKSPYIVEVNDHPLSAISYKNRGLSNPGDMLTHIDDAYEVYADQNCKRIILPCEGFENLFSYYFGNSLAYKFKRLHSPGCLPKLPNLNNQPSELIFACLASDYELKGVDLVLRAWLEIEDKRGAKLILACPNVPQLVLKKLKGEDSIIWVLKAPLSVEEKHQILNRSSVTISPTHVHAGANIIEGMEYGHAIIHFEIHTTAHDQLGKKVGVPYHFYLPNLYGKEWKTMNEFLYKLKKDKEIGLFDQSISQLTKYLATYINDSEELLNQRKRSFDLACKEASLSFRNEELCNLYENVLSGRDFIDGAIND